MELYVLKKGCLRLVLSLFWDKNGLKCVGVVTCVYMRWLDKIYTSTSPIEVIKWINSKTRDKIILFNTRVNKISGVSYTDEFTYASVLSRPIKISNCN